MTGCSCCCASCRPWVCLVHYVCTYPVVSKYSTGPPPIDISKSTYIVKHPTKTSQLAKTTQVFRNPPLASERIRKHPDVPNCIQTGPKGSRMVPNMFENFKHFAKTSNAYEILQTMAKRDIYWEPLVPDASSKPLDLLM